MIYSRNPEERAEHLTDQEAEAQAGDVLWPRSPSKWRNLDLNTGLKFRDQEMDHLLA